MGFLSPSGLIGLLVLPLLVWLYWRALWRPGEGYAVFPGLQGVAQVSRSRSWRQGAAWVYLLAVGLAIVTVARPQAIVMVPDQQAAVMLAIDVSGSMWDADIQPSRIEAAKQSAQNFVRRIPKGVKIGLVSFAGDAILETPPTTRYLEVIEKIEFLEQRPATAIGEGLMESLRAFPTNKAGKVKGPSTVILLTDGRSRSGMSPQEAAQKAAKLNVRVYAIGIGVAGKLNSNSPFFGLDESQLRDMADATGGQYFVANSAQALQAVYRKLGSQIGWIPRGIEITAVAALLAGVLLAFSLLISSLSRRVV